MGAYCLAIVAVAASVIFTLRRDTVRANHDTPSLPPGYSNTAVASLSGLDPIGLAFTPDGRLLITTRPGYLRVLQNNALLSAPALDLSGKVCSNQEQGLLGVVPDPAFATNHFIYVYYTFNKFNQPLPCPKESPQSPVNRVSRFTLGNNNIADPASEVILIDNIPATGAIHNAGDLHFGKDGYLYISVGDGGCDYMGDSGCSRYNDATRDQHVLLGKVLRVQVNADGSTSIPATNPFRGADSARCAMGRTSPGMKCQETFAWGLRNPFRLAFDPNTSATRFWINDVGQGFWEEINEAVPGADYGWGVREGHCAIESVTNCGPQPAGMTNPIFDYPHSIDCQAGGVTGNAISGGAFVPNGLWPGMDGAYLFADYACGRLFKLTSSGSGYSASVFGTNMGAGGGLVTMIFGPYNGSQALYYTSFAHDKLYRITYTGSGNRTPVAELRATSSTAGAGPLTVSFSGSGSSDPDDDALTYLWDFGDGATAETSGPTVSHTYTADGVYNARLRVRDSGSAVSAYSESVRVDVGNTPPVPTIQQPTTSTKFKAGQTLILRGSATDAEATTSDHRLADSALSWRVELVHNEHTHPVLQPTTGNNIAITAPAPEDLNPMTVNFLRIYLTATDAQGRTTTISQDLQPNKVLITLDTNPDGLDLFVNGSRISTPATLSSWQDYPLRIVAPAQRNDQGQWYTFKSWSQGGGPSRTILTPGANATYTATFVQARVRFIPFVPR
jgi:glucose/arabinose dehydrogenase